MTNLIKTIRIFKEIIFIIVTLILSSSLLIYMIIRKLFKKTRNLAIKLVEIDGDLNIFIFLLIAIGISVVLFCIMCYALYRYWRSKTNKKAGLFERIRNISIIKYFINIIPNGYDIVFNWINPEITIHLVFFARAFLTYKKYYLHIIYMLEILPRVIILSTFIIEICMGHLHYYFYSLTLLILPLVLRGLVYILKDIGPRLLPEYKSYLHFSKPVDATITIKGIEKQVLIIDVTVKPEYEDLFPVEYILNNYFYPLEQITIVIENDFVPKYNLRKYIIRIIYHGIHVIGWIYIVKVLAGL